MGNNTKRSSNLELLRIICILFIIGTHFTGQSGVLTVVGGKIDFFVCAITSLDRVSCSIFIIISAWFSVDSSLKIKKVIHVWLTVIMYTIPLTLFMIYIGRATNEDLYAAFFPIERSPLWFAGYYIVLILFSPILNYPLIRETQMPGFCVKCCETGVYRT